jgi:hypothetical protein
MVWCELAGYGRARLLDVTHIGTTAPHYWHRSAALALRSKPSSFDAHGLFEQIMAQMHSNWATAHELCPRSHSAENWRWVKKLHISEENQSPEKQWEKTIAKQCDEDWVNQVPTASGLLNSVNETHCNIDLVHRGLHQLNTNSSS